MTTRASAISLPLLLAAMLLPTAPSQATAGDWFCPCTVFCRPKHPRVHYKCICPQRINSCCGVANWGYYPTCWQQWPFPPNYEHCPVPPVTMNPPANSPETPLAPAGTEQLPAPKAQPETSYQKTTVGSVRPCSYFRSAVR